MTSRILQILQADPRRDIYLSAQLNEYWITHQGGGPFPIETVLAMVQAGTLVRKYDGCECYCLPANQSSTP